MKNICFCEKKKVTKFVWCNQNVNGFVSKMCAVELNSLISLLVGKPCFSGHGKTFLHLTQLAPLATFPKLGSRKYLHFPSHLPMQMRCMQKQKTCMWPGSWLDQMLTHLRDMSISGIYTEVKHTKNKHMAGFDDQVLSKALNTSVKQFLKSYEAASIQVYRLKPA